MAGDVLIMMVRARCLKEEAHYVYRRHGKECFVCGTKVMRQEMEGRNLYWCPTVKKCNAEGMKVVVEFVGWSLCDALAMRGASKA